MSDKFLHRGDAPFGDAVWEKIDRAAVEAAKSQMSARRLLHIEGPYGLGLKGIPGPDEVVEKAATIGGVTLAASSVKPVTMIRKSFVLSARDIATFEQRGLPFDLGPAANAAIACARQEDDVLLNGVKALGVEGLMHAKGVQSSKLKAWTEVGAAADDIIAAATRLDEAGFHGPYALALEPARYNLLFRRYPQGSMTEIEHLRVLVTEGIVKAPAIASGGVLIASGSQFATIVVGQDLAVGFVGPVSGGYELVVAESVALRLVQPAAVCVLK